MPPEESSQWAGADPVRPGDAVPAVGPAGAAEQTGQPEGPGYFRADGWPAHPLPEPGPGPLPGLLATLGVLLGVALLGAPLGWLWRQVVPEIPLRVVEGGFVYLSGEPEEPFAADGWFTVLGFGLGVLAAVAVWLVVRRHRGPLQMLALVLGAVLAAYLAWWVGRHVGVSGYQELAQNAPVGDIVGKPGTLKAVSSAPLPWGGSIPYRGDLLVPALGATLTYALMAGWSRWPSLRVHEEPVYEAPEPLPPA